VKLLNDGSVYFPTETGQWVSRNQQRIAEIISDYDPNLRLQWIPTNERGPQDYAFRVVDFTPGRPPYAVCFGHEADERLLAQIFAADNAKNGGTLNVLDRMNAAAELVQAKKNQEQIEEANEMAHSILRSQKIHYKHGGIDFGKWGGGLIDR
jgi:hypothetical protein